MKITIIGAGIIGLCSAYYLQEAGYEIEIIDKSDLSDGCSYGNAGMITPSHFIPLAAPGVIAKGIRWMFDAKSPFYVKPRMSLELAQWLWQFYRSCTKAKAMQAAPVLRDLNVFSKLCYQELAKNPELDFNFREEGILMLFKNKKAQKAEIESAELANKLGVDAQVLEHAELQRYEKNLKLDALGGVFYPGDAHLYPNQLMAQLIQYLRRKGVQFKGQTTVINFNSEADRVTAIQTETGQMFPVDNLLIAGGSWTPKILRTLGVKLLLQDGKGYSVTLKNPVLQPSVPSILAEAKVAVTPMGNDLRIGGTLEISNLSPRINPKRVQGILESVPLYYPELKVDTPKEDKIWYGFRPCTPDGLPYIGKIKSYKNLTIATGHAMLGLSLGPVTGKLVAETYQGKKPSIDSPLFDPHRF
jgi:D-amino-acid dehydrogenase